MVVTCTGLEELLEGGEVDWSGLADESGRGFIKNEYEMSFSGSKSGLDRLEEDPMARLHQSWPDHGEFFTIRY